MEAPKAFQNDFLGINFFALQRIKKYFQFFPSQGFFFLKKFLNTFTGTDVSTEKPGLRIIQQTLFAKE